MSNQLQHHYALLIGVGECVNPDLSLPVTVNDVKALKEVLVSCCGYIDNEEYIRLLCNEKATKNGILQGLDWLKKKAEADKEATIIIYYSGHGGLINNKYFLVPHDNNNKLKGKTFSKKIKAIPAKNLLVIIDSCHAGGIPKSKDEESIKKSDFLIETPFPENLIQELKQERNETIKAIFTSSKNTQKSWISPGENTSIYTYHLLEALQGGQNYPGDTNVSVTNLMNYLQTIVPKSPLNEYKKEQNPRCDISGGNFDIALLRNGEGLPEGGWNSIKEEVKQNIDNIVKKIQEEKEDFCKENAYKIVEALNTGNFFITLSNPVKEEKDRLLSEIKKLLNNENIVFAVIDPTNLKIKTNEEWYQKLANTIYQELCKQNLGLDYSPKIWWQNNKKSLLRDDEEFKFFINYIDSQIIQKIKNDNNIFIRKIIIIINNSIVNHAIGKSEYLLNDSEFKNKVLDAIRILSDIIKRQGVEKELNFLFLDTKITPITYPKDIGLVANIAQIFGTVFDLITSIIPEETKQDIKQYIWDKRKNICDKVAKKIQNAIKNIKEIKNIIIFFFVLILIIIILFVSFFSNPSNSPEKISEIALKRFETNQLEGLTLAIKSGRDLKKNNQFRFENYSTNTPFIALHKTISGIYKLNELEKEDSPLRTVAFNQSGNKIAAGGEGYNILIWNFSENKVSSQLSQTKALKNSDITSLSFDKEEKYIAVGLKNRSVKLLNASNLSEIDTNKDAHGNEIKFVEFNQDGQKLLTSGKDDKFKVWKISPDGKFNNNNKPLFEGDSKISPRFSPDGKIIAAVKNNQIQLWDVESGKVKNSIKTNHTKISDINFSSDGKYIATLGDNSIRLWDVSSKQQIGGNLIKADNSLNFSFSPWQEPQLIAAVGSDGKVRVWKYSEDSNTTESKPMLEFKADEKSLSTLAFSPNGNYLLTVGQSGKVNIIDLSRLKEDISITREAEDEIKNIDIGVVEKDNRLRLVLQETRKAEIWELLAGNLEFSLPDVTIASLSPKKDILAIIQTNGKGSFYNISGNQAGQEFYIPPNQEITSMSFNPEGSLIAIATKDGRVSFHNVWGNNTPQELGKAHQREITNLIFSPDGKYFATQGKDAETNIFLMDNKQQLKWQNSPSNVVVDFSPSSNYIITGENDGNISIWKLGNEIKKIQYPNNPLSGQIKSVIFNSDENNQYLAAFDASGKAKLWKFDDKEKNQKIQIIEWQGRQNREPEKVTSLSFSPKDYPQGQLIATGEEKDGEEKGTIRIWDMKGREIAEFKVDGNEVKNLKFSPYRKEYPNDNYIVATDENGMVFKWKISGLDDLLKEGCNKLENYFSNHPNEKQKLGCE
jgi:WD40 repeat protein